MSELICEVRELHVEPHPDADRLDIVRPVGTEYVCVSQKGTYQTGDEAVYIGEGALVPERILHACGFWDEEKGKGMLAGSKGDRVKAVKLRGVISQGILLNKDMIYAQGPYDYISTPDGDLPIGPGTPEEVAEYLGVTKYVPDIPTDLAGEVYACDTIMGYTEIENEKRHPDLLVAGEEVVATEKIHGSCAVYHLDPEGILHVASKGFAKKGMAIVRSESNAYWQMEELYQIRELLLHVKDTNAEPGESVTLYAEIHGKGIQDLTYDLEDKRLRVFDIRIGRDRWMPYFEMQQALLDASYYTAPDARPLGWVPLDYSGPYNREELVALANAKKSSFAPGTIREGLVVKAQPERRDPTHGRAIVKIISDRYLTRKGGTEHE